MYAEIGLYFGADIVCGEYSSNHSVRCIHVSGESDDQYRLVVVNQRQQVVKSPEIVITDQEDGISFHSTNKPHKISHIAPGISKSICLGGNHLTIRGTNEEGLLFNGRLPERKD